MLRRLRCPPVLSGRDELVQVGSVDHRRHPLTATGQVDGIVTDARRVDDVDQPGSGWAQAISEVSP
jgi:hypothetical protein